VADVETVTGPIDADELGTTLIHEHMVTRDEAVAFQWPHVGPTAPNPDNPEPPDFLTPALDCARAVLEHGVKTVCEPTAMFIGRDVNLSRQVAHETGLQLVACTGIYTYEHLPPFFLSRDADAIAELFVHDIEVGVQGTDIKATFLKCAADEPGVTPNIEKLHRAVARASIRTGTPIMAHSRPASETGPKQIDIFEEEGVDLATVQMAHTGDSADLDYIERVLERGVWIGLDRFGLDIFLPMEQRLDTASALLERGYADRMFLSQDYCATLDWYPVEAMRQMESAGLARGWSMTLVFEQVIPALRERGMTDDQLNTMLVENPKRWLTS
jgi:phosphotriesterase-related protein